MMIRPFLYDIKRTITSKTVLILMAIILLVSLTIITFTGSRITTTGVSFYPPAIMYYRNAGYHFLVYSYNEYGDPISGTSLTIILSQLGNYTNPAKYSNSSVTDSSGFGMITVKAPYGNYTATTVETFSGGGRGNMTLFLFNYGPGWVRPLVSSAISAVTDKANASKRDVQVFYADRYGLVPSGYKLYYKVVTSGTPIYKVNPFNESEMIPVGSLSSYHQVFDAPLPSGLDQSTQIWFELFAPNGTAVESDNFPYFELRIPPTPINVSNVAELFFSGVFSFFIPLMAIIGSYSSYGKDRLTGVLESVLARPVSRRGLALSRFLSTVLAFSVAAIASVGAVDLLLNTFGGSFLQQNYVLAVVGALVVEVAAFTGLIFLLSHLVKSTGALLGIGIGLFVVLDFFWSLIIFLLTSLLGGTQGSFVALEATFLSYYANPAQFLTLVNTYLLQSSGAILPSSYGVTLPAIVLDGILWAVLPLIVFLYLAVKRD